MILTFLSLLYVFCALLLALYAAGAGVLLLAYWRHRHTQIPVPVITEWPSVAVQLPIYNEYHVVDRLLAAAAALDYPRDRLVIQVLDDSTDETTGLVTHLVDRLRRDGLTIELLHRDRRDGYKAGALAAGLERLDTELVAVFDADFQPAPDFLRRTVPYLAADPGLGMVQARWGHLNAFENALTLGQTLALDGHFVVEQTARSRSGWLLNFSGSAGVWRCACIRAAGGWRATTLTEDLDLSYRAQLAGWRFLYLPEVEVLAELPPQMAAYKQQQARWAQGSTQTLLAVLRPLGQARLSLAQRLMALLHLCQYLPHPLMLLLLLLTPPLLLAQRLHPLPLGPLGLLGLGPPLIYVISQRALYPDWPRRLLAFPALLALGTGLAWNNSRAVWMGLFGRGPAEFRRTPKFAQNWSASRYALRLNRGVYIEALLAVYALLSVAVALRYSPALVIYLALYAFGFALVSGWTIYDAWLLAHPQPPVAHRTGPS
jgi:cellulose synthase/poly-beta-1,6-N-acetylglucosamine synthase-like glycosyltransferase